MSCPARNVVFLSQRVPHPPDRGDRISTHHILRHLRESGCRVRIGCLAEDDRDLQAIEELRGSVAEICAPRIDRRIRKILSLRGLLTGAPLTLPFFRHRGLQRTIARWMRDDPPDLVFMYSSSMGQYALPYVDVPRVMHFAELDSDKWRQYAAAGGAAARFVYGREARELLRFETRIAQEFDASLVVSAVEKELFERCIPSATATVVPNGVDVDHFSTAHGRDPDVAPREPHTLVFTGVMDYEPNVDGVLWFVEAVWPRIRTAHPDARFLIVGNRPVPKVQALDGRDGLVVTGWVDSTPPWFDRASVAIAPLRIARGLQNKVLEAMSMGLPVVATPCAAQGLGEVDRHTLIAVDGAQALGDAVLALFADREHREAVGARAAAFVREHFRWENMFERIDAVFGAAMAAHRPDRVTTG